MIKNNKGVTMMLLVITIILMIILTYLAIFYSQNTAPEAKIARAYNNIKSIKNACDDALMLGQLDEEKDEYYFFGRSIKLEKSESEVNYYATECGLTSGADFSDRTYLLNESKDDDMRRRVAKLELTNLKGEYVVDLENNKYYVVGGASRVEGQTYYEYRDIQKMYDILTKVN